MYPVDFAVILDGCIINAIIKLVTIVYFDQVIEMFIGMLL